MIRDEHEAIGRSEVEFAVEPDTDSESPERGPNEGAAAAPARTPASGQNDHSRPGEPERRADHQTGMDGIGGACRAQRPRTHHAARRRERQPDHLHPYRPRLRAAARHSRTALAPRSVESSPLEVFRTLCGGASTTSSAPPPGSAAAVRVIASTISLRRSGSASRVSATTTSRSVPASGSEDANTATQPLRTPSTSPTAASRS